MEQAFTPKDDETNIACLVHLMSTKIQGFHPNSVKQERYTFLRSCKEAHKTLQVLSMLPGFCIRRRFQDDFVLRAPGVVLRPERINQALYLKFVKQALPLGLFGEAFSLLHPFQFVSSVCFGNQIIQL